MHLSERQRACLAEAKAMDPGLRAMRNQVARVLSRKEWQIDRDMSGNWRLFLGRPGGWTPTALYSTVRDLDLAAGNIYAQALRMARAGQPIR